MECDSMHAAIENVKKNTIVYVPSQWDTVIRMARRRNPYAIVPIKHFNIFDLKKLAKKTCKNVKLNSDQAPLYSGVPL